MRLFQNSGLSPSYLRRLNRLAINEPTFAGRLRTFLGDRFGASHLLKPVLEGESAAFFTNGDDELMQRIWASEHGLHRRASLEEILDRKSTRLNSSHITISYAVFCLKKKKKINITSVITTK